MDISPTIEITFLLAVVFLYMVPRIIKSRWYFLRAHFPVKKNDLMDANFCWGRANIGGIFCRYAIFSAIEKKGIYLKQAIPFSIYLPPIFIDWNEVEGLIMFEDI